MTPRRFALQLTLLAAAVVPALTVGAQAKVEEGFTSLFNGKDLTGWIYGQRANGQENKSGKGYQIESGVIFSTTNIVLGAAIIYMLIREPHGLHHRWNLMKAALA